MTTINPNEGEYPPLPTSRLRGLFDEAEMRAYVDADRERRGAAVPVGWKLVPIESTPEMRKAASETAGMKQVDEILSFHQLRNGRSVGKWDGEGSPLEQAWRAMLEAAPLSPTAGAGDQPDLIVDPGIRKSRIPDLIPGDQPRELRAWIEGAWCAGYYDAGYTYDSAYADKMATEFADGALGVDQPREPST